MRTPTTTAEALVTSGHHEENPIQAPSLSPEAPAQTVTVTVAVAGPLPRHRIASLPETPSLSPEAPAQTVAIAKKHPCLRQLGGRCTHGDACPYKDLPDDVCINWLLVNKCRDSRCRYRHPPRHPSTKRLRTPDTEDAYPQLLPLAPMDHILPHEPPLSPAMETAVRQKKKRSRGLCSIHVMKRENHCLESCGDGTWRCKQESCCSELRRHRGGKCRCSDPQKIPYCPVDGRPHTTYRECRCDPQTLPPYCPADGSPHGSYQEDVDESYLPWDHRGYPCALQAFSDGQGCDTEHVFTSWKRVNRKAATFWGTCGKAKKRKKQKKNVEIVVPDEARSYTTESYPSHSDMGDLLPPCDHQINHPTYFRMRFHEPVFVVTEGGVAPVMQPRRERKVSHGTGGKVVIA